LKKSKTARLLTRDFNTEAQSLHYAMVKKDQCRGLTVALTNFRSGFRTCQSKCKKKKIINCSLVTLCYI